MKKKTNKYIVLIAGIFGLIFGCLFAAWFYVMTKTSLADKPWWAIGIVLFFTAAGFGAGLREKDRDAQSTKSAETPDTKLLITIHNTGGMLLFRRLLPPDDMGELVLEILHTERISNGQYRVSIVVPEDGVESEDMGTLEFLHS